MCLRLSDDQIEGICVLINKAALRDFQISISRISDREELGKIYTPWYCNSAEQEVNHCDPSGHPLKIEDVARNYDLRPQSRQIFLIKEHDFESLSSLSIDYNMILYKIKHETYIAIDGNHGAVAAYKMNCEINICAYIVDDPDRVLGLADLHYWETRCGNVETAC